MMIRVGVVGALGKMGQEVIKAVLADNELDLVMAVDVFKAGEDIGKIVTGKACDVKINSDLKNAIDNDKPEVVVDFTQPSIIYGNIKVYMQNKIKSVIGTTGLNEDQLAELKALSEETDTGCMIAPNFTTGAVLMMKFAQEAAKYFDNAEIVELHHNQKKDAPSGTAVKTAQLMAVSGSNFSTGNCAEEELIEGSRGGNADSNIRIHSVRMPGYIASQEVIFGASGQVFKIRHDSMDRTCYMAGVTMAIKHINENNGFVYGLEKIM